MKKKIKNKLKSQMSDKNKKNQLENNEQSKNKKKSNDNKKQDKILYILSLLNLEPKNEDKEKSELNNEKSFEKLEKTNKEEEVDKPNKLEKENSNEYKNNNQHKYNNNLGDKDDIEMNDIKEYIEEVTDFLKNEKTNYINSANEKPVDINIQKGQIKNILI